jgi:hypothetical protein
MTQPLTRAELEAAISKYGPTLRLHPSEKYVNCSIEYMLSHATLLDSKNPKANIVHPTQLQLPQGPKDGTRYSLSVADSAKGGDFSTAKAYINALWLKNTTYTDLQFWFFSAYNGHATARFDSLLLDKIDHQGNVDLTPLGEHWADWEYAAVRIDNASKEMIGIILSEHGKNVLHDQASIKSDFTIVNETHPVIYSSLNGHANFPAPGPNFTDHRQVLGVPAGIGFDLVNTTADGGLSLDCSTRYEVVAAAWLNGTPNAYVTPPWVGYMYRWGPENTTIHMDTKDLAEILQASLGKDVDPLLHTPCVLLASWLLHVFVRADINGAGAPAGQAPWIGKY